METVNDRKTGKGYLLIFFCFLMYTCSYLGKYGYSANINLVIGEFSVSNAEAGLISTFFFFAYGFGQIFNGFFCKYYNKKIILPLSLIISAILNVAFACVKNFGVLKYIWLLNGFSLSFLWSSIIMLLSEKLPAESLKKAVLIMAVPTPAGILITYGLSALLVELNAYKLIFFIGGGILTAIGALFFIFYEKITDIYKNESAEVTDSKDDKVASDSFLLTNFSIVFVFLAIFAMLNKYMDDGIVLWLPKILVDTFNKSNSFSIVVTLIFPVFGIIASSVNVLFNKKIKDLILMIGVYLLIAAICAVTLFAIGNVHWLLTLALFCVMYFITSCVGGIVSTMAPLYMRGKINSGLLAGLLNGCCYLGSTVSAYSLGLVSDNFGWSGVFKLFIIISASALFMVLLYVVIVIMQKRKQNG